jgi:hypothetical protein
MEKLKFIIIVSLLPFCLYGQDFSTSFVFKDSRGKTDTLIVGYSPNATDSLDTSLGEMNILDSKIDTTFFVYASDIIALDKGKLHKPQYKTKKQILNPKLNPKPACIDIICNTFPLTIKWDRNLFGDTSRSKSFIIATPPGGWFDVGESPHFLNVTDSIIYTSDDFSQLAMYYLDSIHAKPVKVWKLYIGFANQKNGLGVQSINSNFLKIYPNPCSDFLKIKYAKEEIVFFQLHNTIGEILSSGYLNGEEQTIDTHELSCGIYFLKITINKNIYNFKFFKK